MEALQERQAAAEVIEAPAKINLSLHVLGRRSDGYHEIDGLTIFADIGDGLSISHARRDLFRVVGPFASDVPLEGNLVGKALAFLRSCAARENVEIPPLSIVLDKALPVAAGIGGGSADAAALLRWAAGRHPALRTALRAGAGTLGADVPMCFDLSPARVRGIGEIVERLPAMPPLPLLLVNPAIPLSTPSVFSALAQRANATPSPLPPTGFHSLAEIVRYLGECRNDLEEPARALAPSIGDALERVRQTGALLARMSGSGSTVFGLYETPDRVAEAAEAILRARPGWWVRATSSRGARRP